MSSRQPDMSGALEGLSTPQLWLVKRVTDYLKLPIEEVLSRSTDIAVPKFAEDFRNRLKLHHALVDDPFKKKAFEYAFAEASRKSGHSATVTASATTAGADVLVDNVRYSCKTEASANINPKRITISKLMEARALRECSTSEDYRRFAQYNIGHHLNQYDRVVVLRALPKGTEKLTYQLLEIPKELLLKVTELAADHFSKRTDNGSTKATVKVGQSRAFDVRFDGSVEKITVTNLDVGLCVEHASWTLKLGYDNQSNSPQADSQSSQ